MNKLKEFFPTFSRLEVALWLSSLAFIVVSFLIFDRSNYFTFAASLVGATALIFCAKGNPLGQIFVIVFSTMYAIISFSYAYYGEMITYLGMTLPMSAFSVVSWFTNPYRGNKAQVKVNRVRTREIVFMLALSVAVTVSCYFILKSFGTSNLAISTFSVTTSFIAAYLTFSRSAYFALAYAVNDIVLIIMWIMAVTEDISYVSVVVCFIIFFMNDLYGFINWRRLERQQARSE